MKIIISLLLIVLIASPAFSIETNIAQKTESEKIEKDTNVHRPEKKPFEKTKRAWRGKREGQRRKYEFMTRALREIGVNEEEKAQIHELQKEHRDLMTENHHKSEAARKELSELQRNGATEEELEVVITKLGRLHADQLRILMKNRMEMEKILGKERADKFMNYARRQYHKHGGGRDHGPGMPPPPEHPPPPAD